MSYSTLSLAFVFVNFAITMHNFLISAYFLARISVRKQIFYFSQKHSQCIWMHEKQTHKHRHTTKATITAVALHSFCCSDNFDICADIANFCYYLCNKSAARYSWINGATKKQQHMSFLNCTKSVVSWAIFSLWNNNKG